MEERIRCFASLDHFDGNLCVRLWSEDVIFWHKKLQDEFELLIPVEEFQRLCPEEWQILSDEWHRQLKAGIPHNAIVAEANIPKFILTRDQQVELIPVHRAEEHKFFLKIMAAAAEGLWETEDGRLIELDADESPLRRMGMI